MPKIFSRCSIKVQKRAPGSQQGKLEELGKETRKTKDNNVPRGTIV